MAKTVVALFESEQAAQAALSEIKQGGFGDHKISVVNQAHPQLAAALSQAGIPQQDATQYAQGIQQGGALIVAQALDDRAAQQVVTIMDRHNSVDIGNRGSASASTSGRTQATAQRSSQQYAGNEMVVPIIEEQIAVGKRAVETGGVRVQTSVREQPVNEQVTLHEEQVHVERRPVDQPVDAAQIDQMREGAFEVRGRAEEAVVQKQARVVEEVVINKQQRERTENIQDSVRRTDVNVEDLTDDLHSGHIDDTTGRSRERGQ